jgi:CDP-glucose 4,6-dehydratase
MVNFYRNKKVFITGHTGFKGHWLSRILHLFGANVVGYALEEPVRNSIAYFGDIRNLENLKKVFDDVKPEIVFHLAAQPIVRESYSNPVYTYETNIIGTLNILECLRLSDSVKSFVNVTTDKVYAEMDEQFWGYRENDTLGGYEPYSNSKACSELVTESYKNSFLKNKGIAVSTLRAGNVIGGGDISKDRIIPDCVRNVVGNKPIVIRHPLSIRPYQHVLDALFAYLTVAWKQYDNPELSTCYNVGPEEESIVTTGNLVKVFCSAWGEGVTWREESDNGPREASFLKLDNSKLKSKIGFYPKWDISTAVQKTVEWEKANIDGNDITDEQIRSYMED